MADQIASVKDAFRQKVKGATDSQLKIGYGAVKKQERLANEKLTKERQDVENMLQNPVYLTALQQVEDAKLELSLTSWKKGEVEAEMLKRFKETKENDSEFDQA